MIAAAIFNFVCTLLSLVIQCDPSLEAFRTINHNKWNLTAFNIPIIGRQTNSSIFVFGDEVTFTCEEAYMLNENKLKFSYTCSRNGTKGVWIPESPDYVPACVGVFHKHIY